MQPHIITTCWTRLAVDDPRHLGKLTREGSEQLLVARMPYLHGYHASTVRADVARGGPFGFSRFLRPCKVHGNIRAVALLTPSVGKQRAVTHRWSSSIHGQHEPVQRKRVLSRDYGSGRNEMFEYYTSTPCRQAHQGETTDVGGAKYV